MNRALPIVVALVTVLAIVLLTLALIHGIYITGPGKGTSSTSTKYECTYGFMANKYNEVFMLHQGNNSITVDRKSIVYINMLYYSNITYTFIIHKPRGVFILMLFLGGTCAPVIMPTQVVCLR